jgi:hypothetical protein
MHPETDSIFRQLKDFNADSPKDRKFWNMPFLWDSEQKGKFNIWKFLVNQRFVYSAVPPIDKAVNEAISHWQGIELRGTPTIQTEYQYASYWNERKDRVPDYILDKRAKIYEALGYFIKQNLQNIEVHVLSGPFYQDLGFEVHIILGQTVDLDWLCIMPTVPDETQVHESRLSRGNIRALISCKSENKNTQKIFENVHKIVTCLVPITIYGYYDNPYKHQILCTTSPNKIKAIKMGLQVSELMGIDKSLSSILKYHGGEQVGQFMKEKLEDCRCYTISLWESGYTYYIGRTQTGDWMGFKMNSWHEYNP